MPPALADLLVFVGMKYARPSFAQRLFRCQARVVIPTLIEIFVMAVTARDADHLRHGIGKLTKMLNTEIDPGGCLVASEVRIVRMRTVARQWRQRP